MRRRDFISLVGGTLAASQLQVRAQQSERMRRIVILTPRAENDPEGQSLGAAFREALEKLGWTDGRNIRIETRWGVADANSIQRNATELVALQPDVILTNSTPAVRAFQQATGALPIVFVAIADPVRTGVVQSLAHPGGNITGFTNFETSMGSKWLELLKEIAPRITRVALIFNPDTHSGQFFQLLEAAGPSIGIEPVQTPVHNAAEIERALASFGEEANAGLVAMPDIFTTVHSDLIISLATRYRVPAVSWIRSFAAGGGLMSYGIDPFDLYRRAASYVDRILKGDKPADLPVQQPTKFDFVINLKTAKALGLTVPPSLLAAADEVIE